MRKLTITQIADESQRASAEARGETPAIDRAEAESLAPWDCGVIEVDGGWIAFESSADADLHINQK